MADYGLVWVVLALFKARRRGPDRRRAIGALGVAGFSSLCHRARVKSAVQRQRPEEHLDVAVRTPTSSSFPSGHTLAAFCTAFALAESPAETAAYVGFAGAVAISRVHLRAHHPSDVVGGAAIGSVLGLATAPRGQPGDAGQPPPSPAIGEGERQGNGTAGLPVETTMKPFAVTWDYRCPFARNAHEHLLAGLADGADWDVTFLPFTLSQGHVPEGGTPVWDDPAKFKDLVALAAGVVVRDQYPEQFGDGAPCPVRGPPRRGARHPGRRGGRRRSRRRRRPGRQGPGRGGQRRPDRRDPAGPPSRRSTNGAVFGVPTFIVDGRAVFVRLMSRPQGDAALARRTIERRRAADGRAARPQRVQVHHARALSPEQARQRSSPNGPWR